MSKTKYDKFKRPKHARHTVFRLSNGLKIDISNNQYMNKNACNNFIGKLQTLNPWMHNFDEWALTIWRNPILQIVIYLRAICDQQNTKIWNRFYHGQCVPRHEIKTVNANTSQDDMNNFQFVHGERYWQQEHDMCIEMCGDEWHVSHVPEEAKKHISGILLKYMHLNMLIYIKHL